MNEAPTPAPDAVTLERVSVRYGRVPAVEAVDLSLRPGELHVLLGESGCGKTTLLRALAGFEPLSEGRMTIAGAVVDDAGGRARRVPPERRNVGVVFQDYALFPHLSVAANVSFGGRGARRADVTPLLEQLGLGDVLDRMPEALSGGQQQRVALARALAQRPALLLLDEPFSNLDPGRRLTVRRLTEAAVRDRAVTALLVTHDVDEALELADRLSVMHKGRLAQTGSPTALYFEPVNEQVALALGPADFVAATAEASGAGHPASAVCALGRVALRGACRSGRLMIRPEQLGVTAVDGSPTPAHVRARRFRGAWMELELSPLVAPELVLTARVPVHLDPGTERVGLDVLSPCALVP